MAHFQHIRKLEIDSRNFSLPMDCERPKIIGLKYTEGFGLKSVESLRYFKEPKASAYPIDLKEGFESYKFRYEHYFQEILDKVEQFLMERDTTQEAEEVDLYEDAEVQHVYTQRGLLYRMMLMPYNYLLRGPYQKVCSVLATRYRGNLYMAGGFDESPSHNANPRSTFHYKLEKCCFTDTPNADPDTSGPVDENKQTCCLFRFCLGKFKLTYSAEIDGVISDKEIKDLTDMRALNECCFVSTKLTADKNRSWRSFYKVMVWWAQAYLGNVSKIFVVKNNREGIVNNPGELVAVNDLPERQLWNPSTCMKFLNSFLKIIQETTANVDSPKTVYEFVYEPKTMNVKYRVVEGHAGILSDKFIDFLQRQRKE